MFGSRSGRRAIAASVAWLVAFQFIGAGICLAQETTLRDVGGLALRVDAALEIEAVAGPDLIKWPIVADWDSAGRLVLAECGGVSKPIVEHNKQKLHRIVRLVDSNGDGKFDQRIVAADNLAFPEGVLCVGNSLLVSTPPQIWKLTDGDGDGVCEQREVWYDPGTITGCANDLHGPYMGRDGWIYWCKGAFAEQHHTLVTGKQLVTRAAHIFRRRLEGGPVEPVMTGGMDNPVEMAISHTGERFFTSTFLQRPAAGKRDGIAHAVYGGVYGKQNDVVQGHVRTGDLMPIMTHLGPAAPSGLICLESSRLLGQTDQRDTLVAAQFNLHKVTAHRLTPRGATFETEDRELVTTERIDFHPTDIIEAADGSLLVIDTGGWYNLCCPSSGVDQSIAPGGIYRLTSATTRQRRPAGQDRRWDGGSAAEAIRIAGDASEPLRARHEALWQLCRLNTGEAHRALLDTLQESPEPTLRHIAAHAISVQRIPNAARALEQVLAQEKDPQVKRAVAEALGRLGTAESMPILLDAIAGVNDDRMLEHSLLYAMIELDSPARLAASLKASDPELQRAAMIVIDQSGRSDLLSPSDVLAGVTSKHAALRQCSLDILVRHPEWAANHADQFGDVWQRALATTDDRRSFADLLAAWSSTPAIAEAIATRLRAAAELPPSEKRAVIETLAGIQNQTLPGAWSTGLVALLKQSDAETRALLASWLAGVKIEGAAAAMVRDTLLEMAQREQDVTDKLRLLAGLPGGSPVPAVELEKLVVESFLGEHGGQAVDEAARAIGRIQLSKSAAELLIGRLDRIQPLLLMPAITSISNLKQEELDAGLLERLASLPAARTLPLDQLTSLYRNRSQSVRAKAREVVEALSKPPADVEAKLDALLAQLKSGDVARGFQVFHSAKAACSACHRIGYVGGQVGPELARIGATRTRRALLEAIVFPSARLEQSYIPQRVLTTDGQVFNGLIARESSDSIELVTGANQRVTIRTEDIDQRLPSPVSIMPAGLEQQLTLDELADLLTLLEAAK